MPAADDLFRPTVVPDVVEDAEDRGAEQDPPDAEQSSTGRTRKPSGRVRHDEKMTVYVTSEELLDLEHARLTLRRSQGLAVDRGRLVREAIAIALADFEANGEDSVLVQRLTET
jgi:hypothetical protein